MKVKAKIILINSEIIEVNNIERRVENLKTYDNSFKEQPVQFFLSVTTIEGKHLEIPYSSIVKIEYE